VKCFICGKEVENPIPYCFSISIYLFNKHIVEKDVLLHFCSEGCMKAFIFIEHNIFYNMPNIEKHLVEQHGFDYTDILFCVEWVNSKSEEELSRILDKVLEVIGLRVKR